MGDLIVLVTESDPDPCLCVFMFAVLIGLVATHACTSRAPVVVEATPVEKV